ncbi:hypothetical protein CYE64_002525 [Salmonella enterica subsp. enterica serovar Hadar]|nr:hypothetical protein [Salmonella enterica subsp. enterica serovar Hadar]
MFWIVLIIAALFFSWRNYKKNKPLIAARIAEEKEKDRLKDLRRDTSRFVCRAGEGLTRKSANFWNQAYAITFLPQNVNIWSY